MNIKKLHAELSEQFITALKERGLTLADIARKVEKDPSTVSNIVAGRRASLNKLVELIYAANLNVKFKVIMPKIILLNSAMMPQPGKYELEKITKDMFLDAVADADEHFIGYQQNVSLIQSYNPQLLTGPNRAETTLQDGDQVFVMRLPYRVADASRKGKVKVTLDSFEYLKFIYYEK